MSKPREWWITLHPNGYATSLVKEHKSQSTLPGYKSVCVIEKSAYDELKAQAEKLAAALEHYCSHTARVRLEDGKFTEIDMRETPAGQALTEWQAYLEGKK